MTAEKHDSEVDLTSDLGGGVVKNNQQDVNLANKNVVLDFGEEQAANNQ